MKILHSLLFAVLLLCSGVSAQITTPGGVQGYEWMLDTAIYTTDTDSLEGAGDTVTLISNWIPTDMPYGSQFGLVVAGWTGTGSDSVAAAVEVVGYLDSANSGTLISAAPVRTDSITSANQGAVSLGINTLVGNYAKYDIKLISYTGMGTKANLHEWAIFRLKPSGVRH